MKKTPARYGPIWVVPWRRRRWKKSSSLWEFSNPFSVWMMFPALIRTWFLVGPCRVFAVRKCFLDFVWTHIVHKRMLYAGYNIFFVVFHLGHAIFHAMARPWDVALKNGRRYRSWSNEQWTVPGATIPRNSRSAYGFKLVYVQLPWRKITSLVIEL